MQRQRGAEQELARQLVRAAEAMVRWGIWDLGTATPSAIGALIIPSSGCMDWAAPCAVGCCRHRSAGHEERPRSTGAGGECRGTEVALGMWVREVADGSRRRAAVPLQRLQVRAMVSRCEAVLQAVPGKLQSCLQERDAAQQHADEALRAKQEVTCPTWGRCYPHPGMGGDVP